MDFFSMWVDDPIVCAFTILIALTGIFAAYMKYNFMKNIKKQKKVKNNKQQSLKTVFSDER